MFTRALVAALVAVVICVREELEAASSSSYDSRASPPLSRGLRSRASRASLIRPAACVYNAERVSRGLI